MALLRVLKGPNQGALYPVFTTSEPTVIGRDSAVEVALPDGRASRQHAAIELLHGQWLLRDLKSSNGTIVQGTRIQRIKLRSGLAFQVGATQL